MKQPTFTVGPRGRGLLTTVHDNGKRIRRTFAAKTDATKWGEAMCLARGPLVTQAFTSWDGTWAGAVATVWQRHYTKFRHPQKHRSNLSRLTDFIGPKTLVSEVNTTQFGETLKANMAEEGIAGSTQNRLLGVLRTVLRLCHRYGLIDEPSKIYAAHSSPSIRKALTPTQMEALRALAFNSWTPGSPEESNDIFEVIVILSETGLRFNEALYLDWDSVDMDARKIHITTKKHPNSPEATIPMTDRVYAVLLSAKQRGINHPRGHCFPHWRGYDTIRASFTALTEVLGYRNITLHCLRHTFCTRLVEAGVSLTTVKTLARHKSLNTTMRYTHAQPHDNELVLNAF